MAVSIIRGIDKTLGATYSKWQKDSRSQFYTRIRREQQLVVSHELCRTGSNVLLGTAMLYLAQKIRCFRVF